MTQIGTVIDGKYEILKEIGRGGMSTVYLAMDKRLNKQWAVKEIRKKGSGKNDEIVVNSLLAEANLMKRLDHPSLPRIVDIIDNGITIYVIMDYIEGESLDKILNEYGAQPEELVINWAKQLCDALGYLHSQKPSIIYRDMKPANVMLKPEGNIKIIDFGIAREYKEQNLADTTVLGTKGYAPPEQYSGQTDPRSDIYALGMTMHHLLTGVDPRNGEPYAPVRQWNPELSDGIEAIINKCVQPASENRYQSCTDLLFDLEHPELIAKGYKKKQKRRLAVFIAAAGLSLALLASWFGCKTAATAMNDNEYETLVSVAESSSIDIKVESYKKAIAIYPYQTEAYIKLLEAYRDEGVFTKSDSAVFSDLYGKGKIGFDKSSQGYAELNYLAGMLYYKYYGRTASENIVKAKQYFKNNYDNENISLDFEQKPLSDCFYIICDYSTRFFSATAKDEASKSDYEDLLSVIDSTIEQLPNISDENAYDQLIFLNAAFFVIHDRCDRFAAVNISEDSVLRIFDKIYHTASSLSVYNGEATAQKEQIVSNYNQYRKTIEATYDNKQGGVR